MLLLKSDREVLLHVLQAVTGIVEKRHTLPILSHVLLESVDGRCAFTATDLEIQIRAESEPVQLAGSLELTCPARKLQDILRALPEKSEVSLFQEEGKLVIKAGRSRFSLSTLPALDFPRFPPTAATERQLCLPQKVLRQALGHVQFAMAQQDVRFYLNGMLLVLAPGELRLVATDGHRLSFYRLPLDELEGEATEVILPRKTVLELDRLLGDGEEEVCLEVGRNVVRFRFGSVVLDTKVIDGKFPDYEKVIPKGYVNRFRVDRAVLLAALQRTAILSNEKLRGVRLVLTKDSVKILSHNAEQEEAEEDLDVAYDGAPLDIGFNVSYLLDVLNNLERSEVEWAFGDAHSSALVTVPEDDRFRYVVMPMRM